MSKEVFTYECMECEEFFSVMDPEARVQYCPYCGAEEPSDYSYSRVKEGAEQHE